MGWRTFLGKRGRFFWGTTAVILVALLGLLDYHTGFELSLTLFYLIPIFLVAWFTSEILSNSSRVTFSVGAVTFTRLPGSVDEMVKLADGLMVQVKTGGKNGVRYYVYNE